jgi:putative restriction endonuclease
MASLGLGSLVASAMPSKRGKQWTRDELLLAMHLYLRIPFGQQHKGNPRVIELARLLARTPSSVAMKLNNITSLDPSEAARGVRGLLGASALDATVWREFEQNSAWVAPEAEALWQQRVEGSPLPPPRLVEETHAPSPTEALATRRIRLGQDFFRRTVLANFGDRCALTGIAHPALVNASHIVGWASDTSHRLDPSNGIALNRLHDAAFDQHLITFDEDHRLVVGPLVRDAFSREDSAGFFACEGRRLDAPVRHSLSAVLLARHRETYALKNSGGSASV